MKVESKAWSLESVSASHVLVTRKSHGDERIVASNLLPEPELLYAMPDSDFDIIAMGAFMGWSPAKRKTGWKGFFQEWFGTTDPMLGER